MPRKRGKPKVEEAVLEQPRRKRKRGVPKQPDPKYITCGECANWWKLGALKPSGTVIGMCQVRFITGKIMKLTFSNEGKASCKTKSKPKHEGIQKVLR